MIDPKRWLDEGGGATFEERELLQAGRDASMPNALRKRVWTGVAMSLTAIETVAAAGTALQKSAAAKSAFTLLSGTAAKGMTALAIAGGVGLGVASLRAPSEPPAQTLVAPRVTGKSKVLANSPAEQSPAVELALPEPASASPPETTPTPIAERVKPRALPVARPSARPSTPAAAARASDGDLQPPELSPEARGASSLAEESAAVVAIRKTLMSGEPTEALRMLDRARAQFPDGVLGQEREALAVRALVESGQKDAARKRGEAFLRAFPRSPHAAELRALLGF